MTRSLDQNALLHALLADIARQCEWAGRRWDRDAWKVLMVSAHAVAAGRPGEVIQGLEGELVAIRESTARMSKSRCTSLIEYVLAWGADQGVRFTSPEFEEWRAAA